MKIDLDRLCVLAGVQGSSSNTRRARNGVLRESKGNMDSKKSEEGRFLDEDENEGQHKEMKDDADEMVDIDEQMLVQELRRAKNLMLQKKKKQQQLQESRKIQQQRLYERELKKIVESEVENVLKDLNLTAGWIYGKDKPRRSRRDGVAHGSMLKGLGFK